MFKLKTFDSFSFADDSDNNKSTHLSINYIAIGAGAAVLMLGAIASILIVTKRKKRANNRNATAAKNGNTFNK